MRVPTSVPDTDVASWPRPDKRCRRALNRRGNSPQGRRRITAICSMAHGPACVSVLATPRIRAARAVAVCATWAARKTRASCCTELRTSRRTPKRPRTVFAGPFGSCSVVDLSGLEIGESSAVTQRSDQYSHRMKEISLDLVACAQLRCSTHASPLEGSAELMLWFRASVVPSVGSRFCAQHRRSLSHKPAL